MSADKTICIVGGGIGGVYLAHKLLLDQLFLTPQLKIIQFIDFFFDISIPILAPNQG